MAEAALASSGVDQAVVVAVQAVELVARTEKLAAGNVAVVVAVHLLKPVRAGTSVDASRRGHRPRRGAGHAFTGQTGQPAASDRDLEVIRDLVGRDAAVAIGVPRHDPVDGAHHLTRAEPAVSVEVDDAEDRAALVGRRHDQARARGLDLTIDKREQLFQVDLAVAIAVDHLRKTGKRRLGGIDRGQFLAFQIAVFVDVGGLELLLEDAAGKIGGGVAVVDLDVEPDLSDGKLDVAGGELPDLAPLGKSPPAFHPTVAWPAGLGREV